MTTFTLTGSTYYPNFDGGKLISFSADFVINDKFLIQRGTAGLFWIPDGDTGCWKSESDQDFACENYASSEIVAALNLVEECAQYWSCMLTA